LGYLSSYIGWHGYGKWKYRNGTTSIQESRERGIFVKELNYKVENYSGRLYDFKPYIEKGYKYGHHSSKVTVPLSNTKYPFQLSFQYQRNQGFGVLITNADLKKFDSSDAVWGYMKHPQLPDTIKIEVVGENIPRSAIIKVW
jgi:hypothetical protein